MLDSVLHVIDRDLDLKADAIVRELFDLSPHAGHCASPRFPDRGGLPPGRARLRPPLALLAALQPTGRVANTVPSTYVRPATRQETESTSQRPTSALEAPPNEALENSTSIR